MDWFITSGKWNIRCRKLWTKSCLAHQVSLLFYTLQWRHNGRHNVSNHQPHDCLLKCLFRRRPKKIWELRVTGLCAGAGNSPRIGESQHKWPVTREMFPFDDVIIIGAEPYWRNLRKAACTNNSYQTFPHFSSSNFYSWQKTTMVQKQKTMCQCKKSTYHWNIVEFCWWLSGKPNGSSSWQPFHDIYFIISPSAACLLRWTGLSLVYIIAFRLFSLKPWSKPMVNPY